MKKFISFSLPLLFVIALTVSAQNKKLPSSKNTNDVEQIKKLEQIMMTAMHNRDTATISKMLDENFIISRTGSYR